MPLFRAIALFPLLAALTLLEACATKQIKLGSRYIITAPKTPLYKYGPAQSFGPDTTLPQGTVVTMLESTWGYCHVLTESGLAGYVPSDDLKPAPPVAVAVATPKPALTGSTRTPQFFSGRPRQNTYRPTPGGPLFDVNDVPLPTGGPLDEPPPAPKPKFRY